LLQGTKSLREGYWLGEKAGEALTGAACVEFCAGSPGDGDEDDDEDDDDDTPRTSEARFCEVS
jgi:hypothetical protein